MKTFLTLLLMIFLISCSSDDNSVPIDGSNCPGLIFSDFNWSIRINDTIIADGVIKYKVAMPSTIFNPCEEIQLVNYRFVSNTDIEGNRYFATALEPILVTPDETLEIVNVSVNYLSADEVGLGVDYVERLPNE